MTRRNYQLCINKVFDLPVNSSSSDYVGFDYKACVFDSLEVSEIADLVTSIIGREPELHSTCGITSAVPCLVITSTSGVRVEGVLSLNDIREGRRLTVKETITKLQKLKSMID